MTAYFLSELMLAVRNRNTFNDVLMIAQEGIYRCIHPDCVVALFIDRDRNHLQGRFYAGSRPGIAAHRFRVSLKATSDRVAAQNVEASHVAMATIGDRPILDDDSPLAELDISSVLLAPIVAGDRPIGQYLLGRRSDQHPFTPNDSLLMTAIAGHVGMSFEQLDK